MLAQLRKMLNINHMDENNRPKGDIADSPRDNRELQQDTVTVQLPDVKDIPSQAHVHPPRFNECVDTTISSADEEADDLFADEAEGNDSNVGEEEKLLLQRTEDSMGTQDDEDVLAAELDNKDAEGTPLNETIDTSGDDLDVETLEEEDEDDEAAEQSDGNS